MVNTANEACEVLSILSRDDACFDFLSEAKLEGVLTVMLPHTLEVRLIWETRRLLMRHDHVLLLDDLRSELTESLILALESLLSLRGAGIHTKENVLVLVGMGEREKSAVTLCLSVILSQVTLLFLPRELGNLVVEETAAESAQ